MTEITIRLMSVNDVKNFVSAVTFCSCDVDIAADRYIIDAKSIMGIFALDLSKPLQLNIHSQYQGDAIAAALSDYTC